MGYHTFNAIKIGLASPELIRQWSYGEVKKPETINYRTLKPERDGLFCERIFGPTKDWECHCGKYKKVRFKGKICDKCGVEVTKAKVRRERMGHIELAAPVSHIWYFKGIPSRMGLILDISPRVLEKVLYFANYIVIDPGDTPLMKKQILTEAEYRDMREKYDEDFRAGMGAESIKELLAELDLDQLSKELTAELREASGQKRLRIIKRLEVVESFRLSHNRPEWMIMDVVPVIPPEIRPMVQLDGGRFATSDLNDLYRRVINRNNRLKRLLELGAPDIIVRNEKRMLQEAVDALIDNGRRGRPVTGPNNRALKSLSDMLKGKQGRFRQNLLGKRVDYSGRSVIVVGPDLKIYQCGLPKEMALELFKPFVMKKLVEDGTAQNIKSAKKMVERAKPEVWDVLEGIIKGHPVMLNRAPTLHRLGIQAFEPVLVEGRAIRLHPLVCTAFNADFDGDQMAVHVPLSAEAQAEARLLMLSANNLLKPQDGKPVTIPSQDMVLGSYYLTIDRDTEPGAGKVFRNVDEALMAYNEGIVGIHAPIKVRLSKEVNGKTESAIVDATPGRLIFNERIPQDLGFVDRSDPSKKFDLEIMFTCGKKELGKIIDKCIRVHGFHITAEVLDSIKAMGYKYSTKGALTVAVADMLVPDGKDEMIRESEKKVAKIDRKYKRGFITDQERYRLTVAEWEETTKKVTAKLQANMKEQRYNPIHMMADSGARGSINQIRQLAGMRGLMASASGKTIEIPIKSNFREGLTVLEYFIAARGARKGMADTALRTADSGYLTRRLVDVSQDVIIREDDCGATKGIWVEDIKEGNQIIEPLRERLLGRFPVDDIVNPETGEVIVPKSKMMTEADADAVVGAGITRVQIRSVLECRARKGVCAHCYGINLAMGTPVGKGEAVGIIAAQSIGEPGTQLTMRTFHTGGVAGSDITQGLPRVEELFEARKPKKAATLAEIGGMVSIEESKRTTVKTVNIVNPQTGDMRSYQLASSSGIRVTDGQEIPQGFQLNEGSLNPHDILRILDPRAVHDYEIKEVQKVYRQQGVDINDKHIEVIVHQMLKKIRIEDNGDTEFLPGTLVDVLDVEEVNEKLEAEGKQPAEGKQVMLGITKASLATNSFLSAASFQETTKVLTEAAIKGKIDPLIGLKENVIIGKLIPAGTGMKRYSEISLDTGMPEVKTASEEPEDTEEISVEEEKTETAPEEETIAVEETAEETAPVEE